MMNIYDYDQLRKSKRHLSLLLFLLLNIALSIFFLFMAINNATSATLPSIVVIIFCGLALLVSPLQLKSYAYQLNFFAIIIGLLWAWHIAIHFHKIYTSNNNFLLYSLMMVLFVSAISLADNVVAFCLHSLPSALT